MCRVGSRESLILFESEAAKLLFLSSRKLWESGLGGLCAVSSRSLTNRVNMQWRTHGSHMALMPCWSPKASEALPWRASEAIHICISYHSICIVYIYIYILKKTYLTRVCASCLTGCLTVCRPVTNAETSQTLLKTYWTPATSMRGQVQNALQALCSDGQLS